MRNFSAGGIATVALLAVPSLAVLISASSATVRSAFSSQIESILARSIAPLAPANGAGGAAVAVRIGGRTLFYNYGFADQATRRPITSDLLFNVGSVRKLFEATLVAQGVRRRELALDDPVSKYIGELRGDYIRRVTIGELVSHTSGLLLPSDHPPWDSEYYSLAGFFDTLNAWTPRDGEEPGKQHIYSHAGYVLLQLVLERRYREPIADLIARRVTRPLGMASTLVPERGPDDRALMSPQLLGRAVQGYSEDGEPIGLPGNQQGFFDFPGTGQMFTSPRDLAVLLAACLGDGRVDPQIRDALQLTQRELFRLGPQHAQAMAWEINTQSGPTIIDKPGGLDNASAYVGLVPERRLGVVILSNRGDVELYKIARETLLPELSRLPRPRSPLVGSAVPQ